MEDIEKLKLILDDHEKRISKLEGNEDLVSIKKNVSVAQGLTDLLKDSFFDQPKKYGEIIKKLKTNVTFSSKVKYEQDLKTLVKEKVLSRKMIGHQWVYFKNG